MNPSKIDIFIAYAREDKVFLDELRKQLRILKRNGTVNKIWYDGEIIAGQTWEAEIKQELESADIFLLLLSPDFINSDYAYDIEMTKALERHRNGEATLIPIIARACAWHLTPLSELQAPVDGQPLGNLTPLQRDPLYSGIIDAVAKAAQQKRAEKEQTRRYFNDKKAWEKVVQLNTLKSYDNYLNQHPNGKYRSQAESAMAGIKAQQKAEREKIERQAWETAKEQQDYETYLKNYPNGQYTAAAQSAIVARDKEQAQAAKTADKKAFQSAKAQNNIAAYQQYLEDFPDGSYRKAAWKGIQRLEDGEDVVVLPWKKIGLAMAAVLFLGFALWASGVYGDKKANTVLTGDDKITTDTLLEDRNTESKTVEETPVVKIKEEKDEPKEDQPTIEESPPLSLDYRFGKDLIIAKWEGGEAPYLVQLYKGNTRKYSKSVNTKRLDIPITAAYRADAGDYTLTIRDNTNQTSKKMLKIDAPKIVEQPESPPKTSFKAPAMIFVKGDTFTMGCKDGRDKDCRDSEKPAHQVRVKDFSIGKYEVTVEEYLAFADATNSHYPKWLEKGNNYHVETGTDDFYKKKGYSRRAASLPVVGVSWNDAVAYCKWLSRKTGKDYRLPTEAEWEYAARGGQKSNNYQYAGSNTLGTVAWYSGNSDSKPHNVGGKKANELGIYDMSGNVWEWCNDRFDKDYYSNSPSSNPQGAANGRSRVLRGGSWDFSPSFCRVSYRLNGNPDFGSNDLGFRCASSR
ncbi:MAG: SUMF1/EgtB/PvdO family nonheme iron enzyme [Bacteroidota bacterium]